MYIRAADKMKKEEVNRRFTKDSLGRKRRTKRELARRIIRSRGEERTRGEVKERDERRGGEKRGGQCRRGERTGGEGKE